MEAGRNQVVVHFKDGKLLKGYSHDFTTTKETFHLTSERPEDRGTVYDVKTDDLKAIFFVKSFAGRQGYVEKSKFEEADPSRLRGLKITVEFKDGEVIRGISLGYNKNKKGFFIVPIDPNGNNTRIYVVADACSDVKVETVATK